MGKAVLKKRPLLVPAPSLSCLLERRPQLAFPERGRHLWLHGSIALAVPQTHPVALGASAPGPIPSEKAQEGSPGSDGPWTTAPAALSLSVSTLVCPGNASSPRPGRPALPPWLGQGSPSHTHAPPSASPPLGPKCGPLPSAAAEEGVHVTRWTTQSILPARGETTSQHVHDRQVCQM